MYSGFYHALSPAFPLPTLDASVATSVPMVYLDLQFCRLESKGEVSGRSLISEMSRIPVP